MSDTDISSTLVFSVYAGKTMEGKILVDIKDLDLPHRGWKGMPSLPFSPRETQSYILNSGLVSASSRYAEALKES